ncbi:MAG: dTDP-4-dehydrorhamnose reductase, partial [Hyphomicrobium sp.]
MRLLIAGSHGQVAKAFIDVAPSQPDIEACAIGRPALDICNSRTIERAVADINPDVIINAAAYTAVDDAEGDAERAAALNREGAAMLGAVAARRGVPVIHLSTDYVFDGLKAKPYVETDVTGPQSVYGRTKLEGEMAVAAANPRHIILRTAWVYSPWGKNFVKTILTHAGKGTDLKVVNDQRGSPTYAPHLVEAILTVARAVTARKGEGIEWGLYHAAGSGSATWYEV